MRIEDVEKANKLKDAIEMKRARIASLEKAGGFKVGAVSNSDFLFNGVMLPEELVEVVRVIWKNKVQKELDQIVAELEAL